LIEGFDLGVAKNPKKRPVFSLLREQFEHGGAGFFLTKTNAGVLILL
jgi:hypothetical protein